MKKVLLVLCAVIMVLLAGCEPSINETVISKLPDKLIYIAGQDTVLDLTGGELTFYSSYFLLLPDEIQEGQLMSNYSVSHNIDFNAPGTYLVTIIMGPPEKRATFEIQVVTQEEYDAMMAQEE
jgi:hypothetical protein